MRRLTLATALILLLGAAGAQAQGAGRITAGEGAVQATVTYPPPPATGGPGLPGLHLEILRSGQPAYSQPISSGACLQECGLEVFGGGPLQVKDLEGNGQPAVVLWLNTGGAHCCTVVQVYSFDPGAMAYRLVEHDFGDPGAVLEDAASNGHLEFSSADDRFAYAFTSYAYSALPLQIWSFQGGRFVDATRQFPRLLRLDAAIWLHDFRSNRARGKGLGFLAAWAADESLLGQRKLVKSTLAREAAAKRLRSSEAPNPSGRAYVRKLERMLRAYRYT